MDRRIHAGIVAVAGLAGVAYAQNYDRVTIPLGAPVMDSTYDIAPAHGGGCLAVGNYCAATMFDASANVLWEAHYAMDMRATPTVYAVQPTSDGGYILGVGIPNEVSQDCVNLGIGLIKVDGNGRPQWARRFQGEGEWLTSIYKPSPVLQVRETREGGFVVVGTLQTRDPNSGCQGVCDFHTGVLIHTKRDGTPIFAYAYDDSGYTDKSTLIFADVEVDEKGIVILGTADKPGTCEDVPDIDTVLLRTDWSGNVTASWSIDRTWPPPTSRYGSWEYASSLQLRDGVAFLASELDMQGTTGERSSLLAAIKPDSGSVGWAWVYHDMWVSYSAMRFDLEDMLLAAGRTYHDRLATMVRVDPSDGSPVWQWVYIDPRPFISVLFDIEGIAPNRADGTTWGGGTLNEFVGVQMYLLGMDTNGKAECSHREWEPRAERAEISVKERHIKPFKRLKTEEWRFEWDYVRVDIEKPCSQ